MIRTIIILFMGLQPSLSVAQGKITRSNQTTSEPTYTKLSVSESLNGHDYVDFGLRRERRRATCNIGSQSPAGFGKNFSWVNTTSRLSYSETNYSRCIDIYIDSLDEIKNDINGGQHRIIYSARFDAVRKNRGDYLEMPTSNDFAELNKKCSWKLESKDGHKGFLLALAGTQFSCQWPN